MLLFWYTCEYSVKHIMTRLYVEEMVSTKLNPFEAHHKLRWSTTNTFTKCFYIKQFYANSKIFKHFSYWSGENIYFLENLIIQMYFEVHTIIFFCFWCVCNYSMVTKFKMWSFSPQKQFSVCVKIFIWDWISARKRNRN